MPTSIRLDPRADRLLRRLARLRGQTKSDVVRAAIQTLAREADHAGALSEPATAYERVAHVVGVADSGGARLSENSGARFRRLLAERARERRSR